MTSQSSGRMGQTRALLLGVLVVLATIGVVLTFSGDDAADETLAVPEPADDAAVEVSPLLPSRAITAASWRDDEFRQAVADAEAGEGESTSLFDGVEFGDEGDKRRRYEKSVEKTVGDIQGLGVYVAPETDVDEPKKKKKRKR
ncbi:MAG: hypothetical protein ACYTDU_05680 [Planctomycetota bacterium]